VADLDPDDIAPRRAHENLAGELAELLSPRFEPGKTAEREGLPPGYRMRADAHYVDQLSARSPDVPMRLIAVDDIDADLADIDSSSLHSLAQSIAMHGMVQPLLVRRDGARYRLIAGRKRLASARVASVARVPCLVHSADEAQADALARAADVRADARANGAAARIGGNGLDAGVLSQLTDAIATIQSAAGLVSAEGSAIVRRVALDLIRAAAWRAWWQLGAAAILDDTHRWHFRPRPLGAVLSRVGEGFAAESRLRGVDVTVKVADWNAGADLDEDALVAALSGAIVATASLTEDVESPRVSVAARFADKAGLIIEISQDAARPDADVADWFFEVNRSDRPGGRPAAIGAAAARAVARRHGGDAAVVIDARGCTVRMALGRAVPQG